MFCFVLFCFSFFFFKQKTAYEMRISDWSSDVCSSDLNLANQSVFRFSTACLRILGTIALLIYFLLAAGFLGIRYWVLPNIDDWRPQISQALSSMLDTDVSMGEIKAQWTGLNPQLEIANVAFTGQRRQMLLRSEEHTSELQSLMRISYAVFCLKKKKQITN